MLSSFLGKLWWGSSDKESAQEADQGITTEDGDEGWLLVNRARETAADTTSSSTGQQDWDMDSMASDGSWVLMPATFTGEPASPHPMEDLLIEHPTMSVYQQPAGSSDQGQEQDNSDLERARLDREVALRNRRRTEVAHQLQIPLAQERLWVQGSRGGKKVKLTRRALKRQNINHYKGGKQVNKVHKIPIKPPGKRRC